MRSRTPISSLPPSDSDLPPVVGASSASLRCGYIALVGRPNAGKSTLFNSLLGQRLSIVTPKAQTTRSRILGVVTSPSSQMIFLDTPGLLEPSYRLHERMVAQIERSARDADVVLMLLDSTRLDDRNDLIRQFLKRTRAPVVVALNKLDLVPAEKLEELCAKVSGDFGVESPLPISALRQLGLDALLARLESMLPLGPQLYPEDMVADRPERFFAAELIREAAFNHLTDELPYSVEVAIDEFDERAETGAGVDVEDAGGKTYIAATIYVERDSQKGIVVGRKGSRLRDIGRDARLQIEAMIDQPVFLELRVKTRPGWRNRLRDLKEFGYE